MLSRMMDEWIHYKFIAQHQDTCTVVYQWPRKTGGTLVCYLQEPPSFRFQPLVSLELQG